MSFKPILDRAANTDFVVLGSNQHQVFGKFTGKAVLDDGTIVEIKDFVGFAERTCSTLQKITENKNSNQNNEKINIKKD